MGHHMWYQNRFFRYSVGIVLILLIVFLMYQTAFLFNPIINFFAALFFPVLFAGILYYVLRPLVRLLERMRIPRWLAILVSYVFVTVVLITISSYVGPLLVEQVNVISTSIPQEQIEAVKEKTADIWKYFNLESFSGQDLKALLTTYLKQFYEILSKNMLAAVSNVTRFALWLIITPFILFYLLKDDNTIDELWLRFIPKKYHFEARSIIDEIDVVLSTYITGQLLVASSLGLLLFFGYLLIGLNNAFILALFATICITIPIFGSFLALIPALLVGLSMGSWMPLKVIGVMMIAQILESNFISPQIMGKRLNIHPLLLMLILLASGSLYGILGLFLATPVFAVLRVLVTHIVQAYNKKIRTKPNLQRNPE